MRCRIQWVDIQGNPTPDQNEAIGLVWVQAHIEQLAHEHGGSRLGWHAVPESKHFPICADHARQLGTAGMHWWQFEALDPQSLA